MARHLQKGSRLVLATHNAGKLKEVQAMLASYNISVVSAGELDLTEPKETGATFVENALLKAHAAAKTSGLPALADDSGLCVEALDGAPGVHSARWAGEEKDFHKAMQRIRDELAQKGLTTSHAHFSCVLALAFPDGTEQMFEGRVDGSLTFPPRGNNGFGYDPIFVPDGDTRTFGEISLGEKKKISHRASAFALFAQTCLSSEAAA